MYHAKAETTHPREQLPPLSSLFGSSSSSSQHPSRPSHSPYSDGPSPTFPTASPLDIRHSAHSDRPFDGAYFQRPSTAPRQFSFGSRSEQNDIRCFQPPPRPGQGSIKSEGGSKPESPRFESQFGSSAPARTQLPHSSSASIWPPQSPRPRYFSRDTSSSFRPQSEHRPQRSPIHRIERDPRRTFGEGPASSTQSYPPTPTSTVICEVTTGKDGLGPKIWTGTQFLPRFVRQAEVPGEGLCYFYDDGTHCKTVIDGEIVNAHWGVTKAGKPRKRLAIACITCREKKIKCDPDYPRCVQCEKFGRVCKFKNAPRGGQGSPDTPPADLDDILARHESLRTEGESSFRLEKREETESLSPHRTTPDSESHHAKRQRTGYTDFTPVASEASPRPSMQAAEGADLPSAAWIEPIVASPIDHNLLHQWQINPYITNPCAITELISVFFKHAPEPAYYMFPEGVFKSWILSSSEKSLDDLMLIYTILALSTVFSSRSEHKSLGPQYAAIARYACDNRHFSIQLVQSRLILALYYFAINNRNHSFDFVGASFRAASALHLNLEIERTEDAALKSFPFGLTKAGFAECRRRTFWSCYLMEAFNNFCLGHYNFIKSEDVFLRLPCDTQSFEAQIDTHNPFFDASAPIVQGMSRTIGSMGFIIQIVTILGDVKSHIFRQSHRPSATKSSTSSQTFQDRTMQRLEEWRVSLPSIYQYSAENLGRAIDDGKLWAFITLHTVYHTAAMQVNRYIQKSTLGTAEIEAHARLAKQHAKCILVMMEDLARNPNQRDSPMGRLSSPFTGCAIVCAADIFTARFKLENLSTCLASIAGATAVIAELAQSWQGTKSQQAVLQQRVFELTDLTTRRGSLSFVRSGSVDGELEMREPLEKTFERSFDCFYS